VLTLIVEDARADDDIFEDEGGRLDPKSAQVTGIKVNSGVLFMSVSSIPSSDNPPADTDFNQGYSVGAVNAPPFGEIILASRTNSGLTAVDEDGNSFNPVSVEGDEPDAYTATFNLPAGTYVFESTVTYEFANEPGTQYTSVYKNIRTVV
jgi:hypothetical protein